MRERVDGESGVGSPAPMPTISAIIPTIGRVRSLERLLTSLSTQTVIPFEVVVADGSDSDSTRKLIEDNRWRLLGLNVVWIPVRPPNAVRQRQTAIERSKGDFLLLLDDDIELERTCVEELSGTLMSTPAAVATMADFSNQSWSSPTLAWRLCLKWIYGLEEGEWQGQIVGPLLRFGYNPSPKQPMPMKWLNSCNSLIRRSAFVQAGGFSSFFLHRCTTNEDVDLGIKLSRLGQIFLCPSARFAHYHDPGGRVTPYHVAEDDIFNRYMVLQRTIGYRRSVAILNLMAFITIESFSNLLGSFRRRLNTGIGSLFCGRIAGLARVIRVAIGSQSGPNS